MLGTNFTCDSLCPLLRVQGQTFCALLQRFPVAVEHRSRSATPQEFGIIRILRILTCNRQVSMRHKIHRFWSRLCFHRRWIVWKTFLRSFRHDNALLNMSAIWFWCQHTWFESWDPNWFCRTTNPTQLCELLTCLIVGLLPLIIIFITASLSSKMCNCDSFSKRCAFAETWSTFDRSTFWVNTWLTSGVFLGMLPVSPKLLGLGLGTPWVVLSTSMTMSHTSSAGKPSIRKPASSEKKSYSVELWDTEVCFLHIQLIGTNVLLPKKHQTPPDVDFGSSRSPAKSESWNSPNRQWCAVFPTWQHWR